MGQLAVGAPRRDTGEAPPPDHHSFNYGLPAVEVGRREIRGGVGF